MIQNTDDNPVLPNPMDKRLWNWKNLLVITLSSIVFLGFLIFLLMLLSRRVPAFGFDIANPTPLLSALLAGAEALGLISGVVIFGLIMHRVSLSDIGLGKISAGWLAGAGCLAIMALPLIGLLASGIRYLMGQQIENPQLDFLAPQAFSWGGALAMLFMGGIAVPIAEELYFRGVLYRWLRGISNPWLAGLLSSAAFGALHGEFSIAVATGVMGLVLAWFFERSRSLWPPVIIHIVNNSVSILAVYVLAAAGIDISGLNP